MKQLITDILNTPPYQLPPVVHSEGCYTLIVTFRGRKLHKVALTPEECLETYYHFVTKVGFQLKPREGPLAELPIPLGTAIYPIKE